MDIRLTTSTVIREKSSGLGLRPIEGAVPNVLIFQITNAYIALWSSITSLFLHLIPYMQLGWPSRSPLTLYTSLPSQRTQERSSHQLMFPPALQIL